MMMFILSALCTAALCLFIIAVIVHLILELVEMCGARRMPMWIKGVAGICTVTFIGLGACLMRHALCWMYLLFIDAITGL